MLPGFALADCQDLAVPPDVMQHVVRVESSYNPYAIGVVGGRLARQPRSLPEALATARMLERSGYNFSLGLAQVNRYNLGKYGLTYETAFEVCPNLRAGARILADCNARAGGDWGKSFSSYYAGDFTTGFRHGYVQKVYASMRTMPIAQAAPIPVVARARSAGDPRPAARRSGRRTNAPTPASRVASSIIPAPPSPPSASADAAFVF